MKKQMADSIKNFKMPRYVELPSTGLYLDQITQYINQAFAPLHGIELTSSMISNYVKKGYIEKPEKKLYYADQIAYLFFITLAKNVLSMEHINMLCDMQRKTYSNQVAYDYLCEELENMLFYTFDLKEAIEEVGVTSSDEKKMLRGVIIAVTQSIYLTTCFNLITEK